MKSSAFLNYTDATLTLIGLALFVAVFLGSVIWVNLKENRRRYRKLAQQILDEGDQL